jgi:hypothetical protein
MLLGALACTSRVSGVEDDDGTGEDETGTDSDDADDNDSDSDSDSNSDDPQPECVTDSDCPEGQECIGGGECEAPDIGPCECDSGEVCIEEQECVPIEALPSCPAVEVASTETFVLPGEIGDFALAEIDGDPGLEVVGVSLTRAITWLDGAAVESTLEFVDENSLQIAALRANQDEVIDLAVTSGHRVYQLAGDGAGGFSLDLERNYGAKSPRDVARLRTGASVDGMVIELSQDVQEQHLYFDILTNNLPDQELEGFFDRWVVDLDGDGTDELIVDNHDLTAIWRFDGELFVEVTQLDTSFELPSNQPGPETASCDSFAAGDLDGDAVTDIVCLINNYANSPDHSALVPFFHAGGFVFERGEPVVVETSGRQVSFFDLEGDGSPELLLGKAIVDIGPSGSFDCSSPHALGLGEVGDLDGDAADEVVSWGAPQAPYIHDLSW